MPDTFQRCGRHWPAAIAGDDGRPELLDEPAALALEQGLGKRQDVLTDRSVER
jgi:hypothetical protein